MFGRRRVTKAEATLSRLGLRPSAELLVAEVIDRLEAKHSTWGRAEAVEALIVVLPTRKIDSADSLRRVVEAAANMVLALGDVVLLTCPTRPDVRHGGLRYSTRWTLQTEQAVLDTVEAGQDTGMAVAADRDIEAALVELGDDQADAVRRICSGGDRVAVLVGPAGSAKSASLAVARRAWEAAGISVHGVAPSAVAAGVLTEQAGIRSETLAKFLLDAAGGRLHLRPRGGDRLR